jgi:hypothetical protein
VTATATPVSLTWHPGDGSTMTCYGAGTPYSSADNPAAAPDCGRTYSSSSAGQPGGALPPLFTIAVAAFRVVESQALNTSGGT